MGFKQKSEASAPALRKGFMGRQALAEALARREEKEGLRSISGLDIETGHYPPGDRRLEAEVGELLGVPVSVRSMPLSKKRSYRELEESFNEE